MPKSTEGLTRVGEGEREGGERRPGQSGRGRERERERDCNQNLEALERRYTFLTQSWIYVYVNVCIHSTHINSSSII